MNPIRLISTQHNQAAAQDHDDTDEVAHGLDVHSVDKAFGDEDANDDEYQAQEYPGDHT